jgi:hypothetical protein
MSKANVKITNGDMEAWVTPGSAKSWARHGWTVVDDGSSESEASGDDPAAEEKPKPAKKTTSRKAE